MSVVGRAFHLSRAQAFVAELVQTLDFAQGGDLARQLAAMYAFVSERLVAATVHKDPQPARVAERLPRDLLPV